MGLGGGLLMVNIIEKRPIGPTIAITTEGASNSIDRSIHLVDPRVVPSPTAQPFPRTCRRGGRRPSWCGPGPRRSAAPPGSAPRPRRCSPARAWACRCRRSSGLCVCIMGCDGWVRASSRRVDPPAAHEHRTEQWTAHTHAHIHAITHRRSRGRRCRRPCPETTAPASSPPAAAACRRGAHGSWPPCGCVVEHNVLDEPVPVDDNDDKSGQPSVRLPLVSHIHTPCLRRPVE